MVEQQFEKNVEKGMEDAIFASFILFPAIGHQEKGLAMYSE